VSAEEVEPVIRIRLLRFPLRVFARSAEHHDDLLREFALLAASRGGAEQAPSGAAGRSAEVPSRLLVLVDELTHRFAGAVHGVQDERAAALARGEKEMDLEYLVPAAAAEAGRALADMLDEADEFCRSGDLLTLATPPETSAFRRWYLTEVQRQASGEPPTPWPGPWE
jgi:hypothetical protein